MSPSLRNSSRHHEALAFYEHAPETLFFSVWKPKDPFPAPVHLVADLPKLALRPGATERDGGS